jgi:hypothetical protein
MMCTISEQLLSDKKDLKRIPELVAYNGSAFLSIEMDLQSEVICKVKNFIVKAASLLRNISCLLVFEMLDYFIQGVYIIR